jgi:hypothetical protein
VLERLMARFVAEQWEVHNDSTTHPFHVHRFLRR